MGGISADDGLWARFLGHRRALLCAVVLIGAIGLFSMKAMNHRERMKNVVSSLSAATDADVGPPKLPSSCARGKITARLL